jgi:DNA-binding IclR family transcriptional regulator
MTDRERKQRKAIPIVPQGEVDALRTSSVKSADRVLDLLELLASTGGSMSHAELSRSASIPKGSLTPLLRNLVERGYVEQVERTHTYRLGERSYALARRGAHHRDLVKISQPWLDRLVRLTGESAILVVLREDLAERIAAAASSRAVLYTTHVGVVSPLYTTSGGKILLAWLPPDEREAYLRNVSLQPKTDKTIRSVSVLRRQLQTARDEGVAWSWSEFTVGLVGMSVPVLDVHGRAIAALGVTLPESRFDEERKGGLLGALRSTAGEIAAAVAKAASKKRSHM